MQGPTDLFFFAYARYTSEEGFDAIAAPGSVLFREERQLGDPCTKSLEGNAVVMLVSTSHLAVVCLLFSSLCSCCNIM